MVTSIGINDAVIPLQNHPLTLIHYARELGADEDILIENTGITPKQISEGDHYISYKQYAQLARNAIKELNKPDLGLHFGKELNISSMALLALQP